MYKPTCSTDSKKGSTLPDIEFTKEWAPEKSYKLLKKLNDPRFGEISVLRNPNNDVVLVKEKMASSKSEASEDIAYLNSRLQLNGNHLMKFVDYSGSINKELCSTTYITRSFYEFPRSDLFKEQYDRNKLSQEFSASDVAHIAYQMLTVFNRLHSQDLVHGDIRPQLIGYDKAQNYYDLLDRLYDMSPIEKCQSNNIVTNKDLYLSPDLYRKLRGKDKKIIYSAEKNDIFALGLILVQIGTGRSVQNIYLPGGDISRDDLQKHVMYFDFKFEQTCLFLSELVKEMLSMKDERRHGAATLLEELPSHEDFLAADKENKLDLLKFTRKLGQSVVSQNDENAPRADQLVSKVNQDENENQISNGGSVKEVKVEHEEYEHNKHNEGDKTEHSVYHTHTEKKNDNLDEPAIGQHHTNGTLGHSLNSSTPLHTYATFSVPPENFSNTYNYYIEPGVFNHNAKHITREPRNSNERDSDPDNMRSTSKSPNKVVKKRRYVMKENGDVVEVDPNLKLNNEKIKEYFSDTKKHD